MAILRFIFAFVLVLLAVSASARLTNTGSTIDASFPNGSINTCPSAGLSNNSLSSPTDVYIYQDLLLINEFGNNRVLAVSQTTGEAIAVFGQPNFTNRTARTTTTGLSAPYGIYVNDATNTLYIADSGNNRVTGYALASLRNGGDQAAQVVLGQTDFTSNTAGTTQTTLSGPRDVFVDTTGNRLWVLDYNNKRVLWFTFGLLGSLTNGQAATGVIGTTNTSDFTTVGTFFQTINGILVDRQGRLYIADTAANRVIRYDDATVNTPSLAFGQADLTSTANATTATGLNYPRSIAFDIANDILFVSDLRNNRVVGYPNATNITTNGTAATIVVGQSSLTSNVAGCSDSNFNKTYGIYYSDAESILAVADLNNNRAVELLNNITQNVSVSISNSISISFSMTLAASSSASTTNGLCVSCQSTECSGTTEFDNICRRNLGGTGRREGDFYCCVGATPSKTTNNKFTFPSKNNCSNKQKLMDLCSRLSGTQSCATRKSTNPDSTKTTTTCRF